MVLDKFLLDLHEILRKMALKTSAGKPQARYVEQSKLMEAIENLLKTLETIV